MAFPGLPGGSGGTQQHPATGQLPVPPAQGQAQLPRTLFVKGLSKGASERHLHTIFASFGTVTDSQVSTQHVNLVVFGGLRPVAPSSRTTAAGSRVYNRFWESPTVAVRVLTTSGLSTPMPVPVSTGHTTRALFLADSLAAHSRFQRNAHVRLPCPLCEQIARHRSGRSAGFAIVTFLRHEEAALAMANMDNLVFLGRKLSVKW
jgi:RNA recognition motif-containing protein